MKIQTSRQFLARLAARRSARAFAASSAGVLSALATFATAPGALADVTKANNNTNLSLAGSYVGNALPTAADRIIFDATASTATNLTALGFDAAAASNLSILGIVVTSPAGPITINNQPQNVAGSTFNIGASGIDMSAATVNLTINAGISLSSNEAFNVASGRTLTLGASGAQAGLSLLSNTLAVQGAGTTAINELIYGSGGISMTGAGTLTLASGSGSSGGPTSGNFFSGGISQSAGIVNISGVNSSGSGALSITGGTMTITQSQFLLTNGATVNGGTLNVNANAGIAGGTVTLTTGTLAATASNAFQLVTVAANGGTFSLNTAITGTTPNFVASASIGALSGSQNLVLAVPFTTTASVFTLTLGANNASPTAYTGSLSNPTASGITSLVKVGSGTQILNGTNSITGTITANGSGGTLAVGGQFTGNGTVAVNAGTLQLNFGATNAVAANLLNPAAALTLGGGTLSVAGQTGATAVSQTFAGFTTTANTASNVTVTNGAGGGTTALNLGAITTLNLGSAVNFNLPSGTQSATNGIQTTAGTGGALLVSPTLAPNTAFATVGGTDFAAKDATNAFIVPLTGTVAATGGTSLTANATDNADISTNVSTSGVSTINTVRFNNAGGNTVTLGGALTVTDGGILVSSAVTSPGSKITGSTITAGGTAELIVHQFSTQAFTLDSQVTGAIALVKSGPGTLVVTKANTNNTGNFAAYVDSGTLQIGAGGSFAAGNVNLAPNDPTAVFDVNNQTTTVSYLAGGGTTGGYTTLGSSGTLNIATASGASSTYSGAFIGGVNSVINKGVSSAGNAIYTQGIQGPNQDFFGTININAGQLGIFGGSEINATINVNTGTSSSLGTGGGGATLTIGNLGGTGGTLLAGSNASSNSTFNVGYLGGTSSYAGVIANGTNATPGLSNFGKFGSGTMTLSGNNTYTGATQINSGTLIFDYSTGSTTPLATGSALSVGGGTATFRGLAAGGTTATTGTFGFNNNVLSRVVLDNNTAASGITVNLKTTTVGTTATLASNSTNNVVLFDTSSSANNLLRTDVAIGASSIANTDAVAIRTNNGLLATGANTTGGTGYRADVLLRDSTGIGFATTSGTSIIRNTTFTSLNGNTAGTLAEDGTANYLLTQNLTRTNATFLYNTVTLDSTANSVTLIANNIDTFTRFGNGSGSTSERGVMAVGSNGATITDGGGTNQPTFFYNYQTGTTAGQTLTLNMPLFGNVYTNGTGLTVATDKVDTGDVYIQSGVFRETLAQSSGDALTPGAGLIRLYGGVLEIGAHLTGTTSATSTADFSRSVGAAAGQIQIEGDTGFSAFGGNRTVNLGGVSPLLIWGQDNFLVSPVGTSTEGNQTFRLSSAFSDSMIDFQNPIALGSVTRNVDVADGSATVDARLSGVLSGVAPLTVVTANGAPAVLNASAGLNKLGLGTLELTANNTYSGPTTVRAGTLLINNTPVAGVGSGTGTGTVAVTGMLGGTGAVAGATTVGAGGTITGANAGSIGALTLRSTLAFSGASGNLATYLVDIGAGANNSDTLAITGALNLSGTFDQLTFSGAADGVNNYVLATYASVTGTFDNVTALPAGYSLQYNATELDLVFTPVPEPGTWVGGGIMLGLIAWSQRKRFGASAQA